ncbi:hypothetical protein [Hydrogenophaga aquatica]
MNLLFGLYTLASLAHFTHNAEYIAFYPGLLIVYGLLGVNGLLHYTLALCSEHTFATNVTIWAEVVLGITLACAAAIRVYRLSRPKLLAAA